MKITDGLNRLRIRDCAISVHGERSAEKGFQKNSCYSGPRPLGGVRLDGSGQEYFKEAGNRVW